MSEENKAEEIKQESPKKVTHNIPSLNKRIEALEAAGKGVTTDISQEATLLNRIDNLEKCLAKMAHYNGGNNQRILKEFGIELYTLTKSDFRQVN